MTTDPNLKFLVRRDDFSKTRFDPETRAPLEANQVRFSVDQFALTSNNISYAAAGDMLDYWSFFPAEDGWGRIPAMGFGKVVETKHPDVAIDERVFGFFPMASELVIDVEGMTPEHYVDGAPHRRNHAPVYRQYLRVDADPLYERSREAQILLMRGLFMTSFLVDGFLTDHDDFGAETFVLGSASSKTSIALAFLLAGRAAGRIVGITGDGNREFVAKLGLYDTALGYGEAAQLSSGQAAVFVDFSGNGPFVTDLHKHLGDTLKHHCFVGATHWDNGAREENLPGPEPSFFFAPGEIKNRLDAWGAEEFQRRIREGWGRFCASSDSWLEVRHHRGPEALADVYASVLGGKSDPHEGHVLSLAGANS